jgi:hypothetical protein
LGRPLHLVGLRAFNTAGATAPARQKGTESPWWIGRKMASGSVDQPLALDGTHRI